MKRKTFDAILFTLCLSSFSYVNHIDRLVKRENPIKIYKDCSDDTEIDLLNYYTNNDLEFNYHQYVKLIAKELSVNNKDVFDAFYSFNYLLYNDLLSEGDFSYSEPSIENIDYLGVSIMANTGVCRNMASLLNDVLHEMGYNTKMVIGEMYLEGIDDASLHACVLYSKNGINYLLDPTNEIIYLQKTSDTYDYLTILYGKITFKIKYEKTPFNEPNYNIENMRIYYKFLKNFIKNFITENSYYDYEQEYLLDYEEYANELVVKLKK